jgi:hypothetical protein
MTREDHRWDLGIWISSGFDEPGARRERGRIFRQALRQRSAGTLEWMRRLHHSHIPEAGPYSICMHRADAATVSYTEVLVSARRGRMRYQAGAPCERAASRASFSEAEIGRRPPR